MAEHDALAEYLASQKKKNKPKPAKVDGFDEQSLSREGWRAVQELKQQTGERDQVMMHLSSRMEQIARNMQGRGS